MHDDRDRWWNLNNPYAYRDDNLRALGFKTYRAYLKSALWFDIRQRVLDRAGGRCARCGRPATQIHHRAYDRATLRGDCLNALTAACARCHVKAEEPRNKRRPRWDKLIEANAMLQQKRYPHGKRNHA